MRYSAKRYAQSLRRAAGEYRYPAKTYDFIEKREWDHGDDMARVERLINTQLMSENRTEVKDGLSNVLYWGYVRQDGRGRHRVRWFREKVKDDQLDEFVECRRGSACVGIEELQRLGLPQFSQMSFVSKILMFMCPDRYPVLDLKIARFAHCVARRERAQSLDYPPGLSALLNVKLYRTRIPLTRSNMRAYHGWSDWCCGMAAEVNRVNAAPGGALRAVDVERAIFWCIDQDRETEAMLLLLGPK